MMNGIIDQTGESKGKVEKETLIQKIQADLLEERTKKGRELTPQENEAVIGNYGTITTNESGKKLLKTTQGNYEILLSEIISDKT